MLVLSFEQSMQVTGAVATIGGYTFETPEIRPECAQLMANMYNWDLEQGHLIGYHPDGYHLNPYTRMPPVNISSKERALFNHFMHLSIPASYFPD